MATNTTKQISTYVEPENATIQKMKFKSSDKDVVYVTTTGLVKALAPGKATITVTALDGSSQYEKVVITVLEDLLITDKNVDTENEVIVIDKTYGNVTIDESVGDADIYLAGVNVKNKLILESGEYSVYTYDSDMNEVVIDEAQADEEIVSFTTEDENEDSKTPKLVVGSNTKVSNLQAKVNAMIKQEDGSEIEGLTFTQDKDGKITLFLEGYVGNILLDASFGDMEIVSTGSKIGNVSVSGGENAGNVVLTDAGDSEIDNLTLTGAAKIEVAVPTKEVTIDEKAKGSSLTTKGSVGTIKNAGAESKIKVGGTVDNFVSEGKKADIDVAKGGYVGTIDLTGESSLLYGAGEVSEAYVNADNCRIDTVNTLVTVGEAKGTNVQGSDVKAGSSTTTEPPAIGGGGGGGITIPEPPMEINVGDEIYVNDYEEGPHGLTSVKGTVSIAVVDGGNGGGKAAKISSKSADWAGAGINLGEYLGKHVTIRIKADIKADEDGTLKATVNYNSSGYNQPEGCEIELTEAGTWYTLNGTFELGNDIESAILYFESPNLSNYYLDNVSITVESIGEAIRVEGVSLDQNEIEIRKRDTVKLNAILDPLNADNKNVTWESENASIASVDNNGNVTGVGDGTTRISATTADGGFKAYCSVTVAGEAPVITPAPAGSVIFDDMEVNTTLKTIGWGATAITAKVIIDPNNSNNRLLEVKPSNYNGAAVVQMTIPEGTTLGDYAKITYKAAWISGDVNNKTVRAEAGTSLTGQFGNEGTDARLIGTTSRGGSLTTALAEETITLNGTLSSLSGTIELAIGISCSGGTYYLDDIVLVPKTGGGGDTPVSQPILSADFEDGSTYELTGTIDTGISFADEGYNSNKSIKTVPGTSGLGWGNPGYSLSSYAGKTVTLITYMKHDDAEAKELKATFQIKNPANPDGAYDAVSHTIEQGVWTQFVKEVVIPEDATSVHLYFETNSASSFFIDNFLLYQGTQAQAEAAYTTLFPSVTPSDPSITSYDFEGGVSTFDTIGLTAEVITTAQMADEVKEGFATSNGLKVVNDNWNTVPKIAINLPAGTTLADYTKLTARYYSLAGTNARYKNAYLLAGEVLDYSGDTLDGSSNFITSVNNGFGEEGAWRTVTFDFTSDMVSAVTGSAIEIGLGMSAPGGATYILDDIAVLTSDGTEFVVENFDGAAPPLGKVGQSTVTTSIVTPEEIAGLILTNTSSKVLKLTNTDWNQAVKLDIVLPDGKTINDYEAVSFKVFMPRNTVDANGFYYKDFTVDFGTNITTASGRGWSTADHRGIWYNVDITIDETVKSTIGTVGTFEIALGCSTGETTPYYIDGVNLVPVP
nr:Ig-like domain-containing protein [Mobilitalea sibirica]